MWTTRVCTLTRWCGAIIDVVWCYDLTKEHFVLGFTCMCHMLMTHEELSNT